MSKEKRQYPREAFGLQADDPGGHLIDMLFFASLGKEEGAPTRVRILYHDNVIEKLREVRDAVPVADGHLTRHAWEIIPLDPKEGVTEISVEALRKIAPAAELPRAHVIVGPREDGQLAILGIAHRLEHTDYNPQGEEELLFLHAPKPGHLTLTFNGRSHYYEDGGWVDVVLLSDALYSGDSVIRAALGRMCEGFIDALPKGYEGRGEIVFQVVHDIVKKMATMRHGGLVAMSPRPAETEGKYQIPAQSRHLLTSKIKGCAKVRAEAFWEFFKTSPDTINDHREQAVTRASRRIQDESLEALVAGVAQLTAVDNALLLGPNLEVICAGFPIKVGELPTVWEATLEGEPCGTYILEQHGSRHRAAAAFAYQNPGGLVFLASQDGAIRCMHRPLDLDKVLLWRLRVLDT